MYLQWNTDTCIAHLKSQFCLFLAHLDQVNIDIYIPSFCKFDGIAHQIDDDLSQANGIAYQVVGNLWRNPVGQLKPLLTRPNSQRLQRIAKRISQRERNAFQFELASLYLGQIENIVEQYEQRICRIISEIGVFLLPRCQFGIAQQFDHPHNAVHRRANLVAHIGQKLALGLICCFGCYTGIFKLFVLRLEALEIV